MKGAGLAQLVQEIKLASENIRKSDDESRHRLGIEASVNELFKRTGHPGAEWNSDLTDERKSAIEMCRARHNERLPKSDLVTTE